MRIDTITYLKTLHQHLDKHFNLDEFQDLCLYFAVDVDNLGRGGKSIRMGKLLQLLGRTERVPELIAHLKTVRPKATWTAVPNPFTFPDNISFELLPPPPPQMALPPPSDLVQRPHEYNQLINHLLTDENQPVAITASIKGAGGFGKTTLAQAVCHDERIIAAFPDGILWATIGDDRANVIQALRKLYRALADQVEIRDLQLLNSGYLATIGNRFLTLWNCKTGDKIAQYVSDAPILTLEVTQGDTIIIGDSSGHVHFLDLV